MTVFSRNKKYNFEGESLLIVDGSFHLYRSYYAFSFLVNEKSFQTGAIYGFIKTLRMLILNYEPTYVTVVFDSKEKGFRRKLFNSYKCNRPKTPDDLIVQIDPLKLMIQLMGVPVVTVPKAEGDDVIGSLVYRSIRHENITILISTGDKDLAQLVKKNVLLIDPLRNILGPEEIFNKYGVYPNLIADFFALAGDRSDNIPGIPGVGKKTAVNLLNQIGPIKKIYQNLSKIDFLQMRSPGKIRETLLNNQDTAILFRKITTIVKNLDLTQCYSNLSIKNPNSIVLKSLFIDYGFKKWLSYSRSKDWFLYQDKTKSVLNLFFGRVV
ncbi:5'-3' exonuclease [Candidatus Riesia pediculischaeffi]|uniref:5'-3' exonuclease domain-containing protein n=1 Tax=Candidatus Riesia pediculischaeffi TaxID=428411 RepID=A0A1V0HKT7_9ENTR|nr:5'-3' exonuclease H3TH domain-containing protein [Candidatus Riesia pediculischaeffi]ARC53467.1 hypothetical protein AOQ87_02330 [Candidatus Riesia pediculischaeffi]